GGLDVHVAVGSARASYALITQSRVVVRHIGLGLDPRGNRHLISAGAGGNEVEIIEAQAVRLHVNRDHVATAFDHDTGRDDVREGLRAVGRGNQRSTHVYAVDLDAQAAPGEVRRQARCDVERLCVIDQDVIRETLASYDPPDATAAADVTRHLHVYIAEGPALVGVALVAEAGI